MQKTMQRHLCLFTEVFRGIHAFHIYVLYAGLFSESNSPHTYLREEAVQWSLLSRLSSNRKMPTSLSPMQKYYVINHRKDLFLYVEV